MSNKSAARPSPLARPGVPNTASKNGQVPAIPTPTGPPKKGSYREIMERAKSAQASAGQIGKIQHKRIEKLPSKREREEMRSKKGQRIQAGMEPGSKFQKAGGQEGQRKENRDGKGAVVAVKGGKPVEVPVKKIRKAALATTGYTGTARPKTVAAAKGSASASSRNGHGHGHNGARRPEPGRNRYAYADEEDEEDDRNSYGMSDEERGYDSEGSSDMEAAAFEVDEEEEKATRIARREDVKAAEEEARLKREKEEKKRRLMAMAASRGRR